MPGRTDSKNLVDAVGTRHTPAVDARIVSLVPSITELLCELGLVHLLVGRTAFCVHPKTKLHAIAKVGGTKNVNLTRIRALAPTHVIVNIDENEKPTVAAIAEFVPHIVVTHPIRAEDNLALFRMMGDLFGAQAAAEILCERFTRAFDGLTTQQWPTMRVAYLIWKDPWMTVTPQTYIGHMLSLIGWHHIAIAGPKRYPEVDLAAIAPNVDALLLSSEPYRFAPRDQAQLAQTYPGKRVLLLDGEMLSWYGSRAILALTYLDQIGHGAQG